MKSRHFLFFLFKESIRLLQIAAMEFCPVCDNMLYIKAEANDVVFHCKNCMYSRRQDDADKSICITSNSQNDKSIYSMFMNPYLRHDPTLPRVDNIDCPNGDCTKPPKMKPNVIYLKYDAVNMKYLYNCTYCQHFWTLH